MIKAVTDWILETVNYTYPFLLNFVIAPEGSPQNITPAATSATSVTLAWEPLTHNVANGLILGYHIFLFDKLRNVTRNLTVESLHEAHIEDLFPYTDYEARIVPFNSKGEGNASEVIPIKTKEAGKVFSSTWS